MGEIGKVFSKSLFTEFAQYIKAELSLSLGWAFERAVRFSSSLSHLPRLNYTWTSSLKTIQPTPEILSHAHR